jgi:hypothetical protein
MIWKTSKKKNETEIQNNIEGHSSRQEQAEDKSWNLMMKW